MGNYIVATPKIKHFVFLISDGVIKLRLNNFSKSIIKFKIKKYIYGWTDSNIEN